MADLQYITDLLFQRFRRPLSNEEIAELQAWAAQHPAYMKLLEEIDDEYTLEAKIREYQLIPGRDLKDDTQLWNAIKQHKRSKQRHQLYIRVAAAAALILAIGFFFLGPWPRIQENKKERVADIGPGGNKATLTLADGREVELSNQQSGIVVGEDAIKYADANATPVVSIKESGKEEKNGPMAGASIPVQLSLSTPRGGQYQVILPDGTKVWLNALSTLKYPNWFSGNTREVEIIGEGYFQVADNPAHPFIVKSKEQEVRVIGTAFNISSYPEDGMIKTTLASGAVRVSLSDAAHSAMVLKPGEQSMLESGTLAKKNVSIAEAIAWKRGRFSFDNKTFEQVMTELTRWYDIEVVYEGAVPEAEFFGDAVRNNKLSTVLRLLESTKVGFRIEGRKLIITRKAQTEEEAPAAGK